MSRKKTNAMRVPVQKPLIKYVASVCALVTGLALVMPITSACADEDPFQIDTAHWMSFDHYKDAVKRGVVTPAAPATSESEAPPASSTTAADESTGTPQAPAVQASSKPVIAAPTRPLDLPPMPGLNKGYQVQVTTTEDDTAPATAAPVITADPSADAKTDIHLSDRNWQDPASIMRFNKSAHGDEEDAAPIDVRMTYLPDRTITPIPSPERTSGHHDARLALEKSLVTKKNEKKQEEAAACAAIDAYKKQQLDAIQSDRQTLKALQEAIASLGLQKQLGFMTSTNSALTADGQSTPTSVDVTQPTVR